MGASALGRVLGKLGVPTRSVQLEHEAEGVVDCEHLIKSDTSGELAEAFVGDSRCLLDEYLGGFANDGDGGPKDPRRG